MSARTAAPGRPRGGAHRAGQPVVVAQRGRHRQAAPHVDLAPVVRRIGVAGLVTTASFGGVALVHGGISAATAAPSTGVVQRYAAVDATTTTRSDTVSRDTARVLLDSDGPAALRVVHVRSFAPDHPAPALADCPVPDAPPRVSNGQVPEADLCTLPGTGQRLRSDAAAAWVALDAAFVEHFGSHIAITDSYRPLAVQERLFVTKPLLAAVPGTSQHGLGIAVDLASHVQTLGSVEHAWMLTHAPGYGWDNPAWARPGGSKLEPWHWEYTPPD